VKRTKPIVQRKKQNEVKIITERLGKPSKFEQSMVERVEEMSKLGLTIAQMAKFMDVPIDTLQGWFRKIGELREAYEKGRWIHDHAVQLSLLERALGFEYIEEKEVSGIDAIGRPYKYKTRTKKKVLGDTTAQIFWLKNRDPERWRDTYAKGGDINLTQVNLNNTLKLESLDEKEKRLVRSVAIKQLAGMNDVSRE
jgi:hypothetical protein